MAICYTFRMKQIASFAVCGAALFLSSCSLLLQQQSADVSETEEAASEPQPPEPPRIEETETESVAETVATSAPTPSPEQQEAARQMMIAGESEAQPVVSTNLIPEPVENPEPLPSIGIPGGRSLRMGNPAPPEEAISIGENAAPKPNSVERRGLRSPSLPKTLPMDINGKLTPSD